MIVCYQIVALWIPFWQINPIYCESCLASTPTVKEVENCPNTTVEWQRASDAKQCQKMLSHNCKSFVYHCLMNEKEDAFLEVCAPTWWMSGFCPMFNTKEERVIDNFKLDCTSFKEEEKCPSRFISTDAYKYQTCYEHVRNKIENNSNIEPNPTCKYGYTASSGSESSSSLIVAIVIVAILTVLVILLFTLLFLARKQIKWNEILPWKENSKKHRSSDQEEGNPLIKEGCQNDDIETGKAVISEIEKENAPTAIQEISNQRTEPKKSQSERNVSDQDYRGKVNEDSVLPEGEGETGSPRTNEVNQKFEKHNAAQEGIGTTDTREIPVVKPGVQTTEINHKESRNQDSEEQLEDEEDTNIAGARKGHHGKPAVPQKPIIPVDSTVPDFEEHIKDKPSTADRRETPLIKPECFPKKGLNPEDSKVLDSELKDQERTDIGTEEVHQEFFKPEGQLSTTGNDIQRTCSNGNIPDDTIGREEMKDPTNMEKVYSTQDNNQEASTEYKKPDFDTIRQRFEQQNH